MAKLDRLARDVFFIASLEKSKINFECTDILQANKFTIHILSAIAQNERELISDRVRAAMKQAKKRGKKFGTQNPRARKGVQKYHKKMKQEPFQKYPLAKESIVYSINLKPKIEPLIKAGMNKTQIAEVLTAAKIKTVRGKTKWTCDHVSIVLKKLGSRYHPPGLGFFTVLY